MLFGHSIHMTKLCMIFIKSLRNAQSEMIAWANKQALRNGDKSSEERQKHKSPLQACSISPTPLVSGLALSSALEMTF